MKGSISRDKGLPADAGSLIADTSPENNEPDLGRSKREMLSRTTRGLMSVAPGPIELIE